MAAGKKDQDGLYRRAGIYYCWIRGRRYSTRCRSRKAALAARDRLERAIVDPVYRASYSATVGGFAEVTIAEVARRGRSPKTVEYYRSKLGHLVRVFGEKLPLAELSAERVDEYIDTRRGEGSTQHTISKELGAARHLLRIAKRRQAYAGDIDALFPVGFDGGYDPRRRALTEEELPKLLAELPEHWRGWAAFAVATAARKSEVERAEACDVSSDLTLVYIRGRKTELSDDTIAVPVQLLPLMALALECGSPEGPMFGVWGNATRDLEAACDRAGIAKVTPNDLRRTHATLLRRKGVSVDVVARQLRHADSRMAERVYGRLQAEDVRGLLTSQIRHSETVEKSEHGQNPGVSDGNRTRDNWSHNPNSSPIIDAIGEEIEGNASAASAPDATEPSTNSSPRSSAFRAQAWLWFNGWGKDSTGRGSGQPATPNHPEGRLPRTGSESAALLSGANRAALAQTAERASSTARDTGSSPVGGPAPRGRPPANSQSHGAHTVHGGDSVDNGRQTVPVPAEGEATGERRFLGHAPLPPRGGSALAVAAAHVGVLP